jgi:hypothetical protein
MSERKLMATEEIVVEPQNHSNQQERSIMASSSEPVKHSEQLMLEMDQDQDALLAKAPKWGDNHADIEIQAMWPGAPSLMRWTREQNSMGGTNRQATHDANALMGVPSRYELTFEDRSLGGSLGVSSNLASGIWMPNRHPIWHLGCQTVIPFGILDAKLSSHLASWMPNCHPIWHLGCQTVIPFGIWMPNGSSHLASATVFFAAIGASVHQFASTDWPLEPVGNPAARRLASAQTGT